VRGCVDLINAFRVQVVFHQNSVLVALRVVGVVVHRDDIRQIIRIGKVEVPDAVVPALSFILNYREQTRPVLELMESVFSPRGIALRHHVVVHAPLNVPLQQLEASVDRTRWPAAVCPSPASSERWGRPTPAALNQTKSVICRAPCRGYLWKTKKNITTS